MSSKPTKDDLQTKIQELKKTIAVLEGTIKYTEKDCEAKLIKAGVLRPKTMMIAIEDKEQDTREIIKAIIDKCEGETGRKLEMPCKVLCRADSDTANDEFRTSVFIKGQHSSKRNILLTEELKDVFR